MAVRHRAWFVVCVVVEESAYLMSVSKYQEIEVHGIQNLVEIIKIHDKRPDVIMKIVLLLDEMSQ